MKIKQQITTILNKQMDRQDFLRHIAIGAVVLTGVGPALRLLEPANKPVATASTGYGGSAYGGDKESV